MLRLTCHRQFTVNHTWHLDAGRRRLFLKANRNHEEARAEAQGHAGLQGLYTVPGLRGCQQLPGWTILVYDRWGHIGSDTGLFLDEITHADLTGDYRRLDRCLADIFATYRQVVSHTMRRGPTAELVGKLYQHRAMPGGRLDDYYGVNAPWRLSHEGRGLRPSGLAALRVTVNGTEHSIDLREIRRDLQTFFAEATETWAATTQGDPTDLNIGWSPDAGPVWFDYDTAGLNALAGEFACFLLYQRLHGAWLTPRYNSLAFRDHQAALHPNVLRKPAVELAHAPGWLEIDYRHDPGPARRHVMSRYLNDVVRPIAQTIGADDLAEWLRPYLAMRLLAVYNLAALHPKDAALSLALLADTLDPTSTLADILALGPTEERVTVE